MNSQTNIVSRLSFLWSWLTDGLSMFSVNRKLKRKLDDQTGNDPIFTGIREMKDADLAQYVEDEWARAQVLDGKLAKLTATLSVALTLGGVVSNFIVGQLGSAPAKWALVTFIVLALSFFLCGAILGFNGLRPKPRYGYGPPYLNKIASGGKDARRAREAAAEGFLISNLLRNNEASAAIDFIRNGIVFYGVALCLALVLTVFSFNRPAEKNIISATEESNSEIVIEEIDSSSGNSEVKNQPHEQFKTKEDPEEVFTEPQE